MPAPSVNPHGTRESSHAAAVNRLTKRVGEIKTKLDLSSRAEALQRLQPQGPPVDADALRAGALMSIDPNAIQRVLYLMTSLSSSLSRGDFCCY